MKLGSALKRLVLGFLFIVMASSILLLSDWNQRKPGRGSMPRIAVLQHASTALLDDAVKGVLGALADAGYQDGRNAVIQRFNAENDMPTDNAIAKEVTSGKFDMVITISTLSMQAVANANKSGKTIHVFGAVADPFSAGIGLRREDPRDHPGHLVGIGSFLPVAANFELARRMFPGLKTVGLAWNPAEANSRAFTIKAREVCQTLGIELLEATVDNSSGVGEAASSLVSRGAQALWIGGDVTVMVAADAVIAAGRKGRVPVFALTPPLVDRGTIFDLGADFTTVGRQTGELAVKILHGASPAEFAIENLVPERLLINKLALKGLKEGWSIPDDVIARADMFMDDAGTHEKVGTAKAGSNAAPAKQWRLSMVQYSESPAAEEAEMGFMDGMREAGLTEGKEFTLKRRSAQGDVATLNGIMDAVRGENADMLITFSTPTLQLAVKKVQKTPIVFSFIGNAVLAGAGRSNEDHLPNVAGSILAPAFDNQIALYREVMPASTRCGTIYTPAELNSAYYYERLVEAGRKAGVEVVGVGATNASDVGDAALALAGRRIDALCQLSDNLTGSTFPSIAKAAQRSRLPIFSINSQQAKQGASVVLSTDYHDNGRESALIAARIMRGERPATIPFKMITAAKLIINKSAAASCGLVIPQSVMKRADQVID